MTASLHPDARRFLDLAAQVPSTDGLSVEEIRANQERAVPLTGPAVEMAHVEERQVAGVPVRVYTPAHSESPLPSFLYLHGGGWATGSLNIADAAVRAIAAESGAIGISIDYRLAPEHPFPAAIDDALAVATAALEGEAGSGIDPTRVAVTGESAGGNIAAVVAQQLRGHSPALVHQGLVYPCTDLSDLDTPSYRQYGEGHFLTAQNLDWYIDQYTRAEERESVKISPARNDDLTDLPPTTVIVAECDPLRDQGEAYGRAMAEQGNRVTTVRFAGQAHPFVQLGGVIEDAHVARRFLGRELMASFARGQLELIAGPGHR